METATTAAAAWAATGAEVTAAVVLEVVETLDELETAVVLEVEDDEVEGVSEVGVPAGQSEPASAGGVQGIISK